MHLAQNSTNDFSRTSFLFYTKHFVNGISTANGLGDYAAPQVKDTVYKAQVINCFLTLLLMSEMKKTMKGFLLSLVFIF